MGLPITYRKSRDNIITTYNYIDIADGTGIIKFYLTRSKNTSGEDYHLITQTLTCEGAISVRDLTQEAQDFDLTAFNLPKTIKGIAYLSGELSSGGNNASVSITLKHWDGTNETPISATITSPITTINAVVFLEIPITTVKQFKKGDVLRATVTEIGSNIGDGFGIDPSGQGDDGAGNKYLPAILSIPFKLTNI